MQFHSASKENVPVDNLNVYQRNLRGNGSHLKTSLQWEQRNIFLSGDQIFLKFSELSLSEWLFSLSECHWGWGGGKKV